MKLSKRQLNESIKMSSLTKGARTFNQSKYNTISRRNERNSKLNLI